MFDRNSPVKPSGLDLHLLEEISVSVLVIGIHIFYFFLVAPLSCLSQTCCWALLWTPKAPLLSQLISLPWMELPQMWEPRLTFSSLPRVQVLSCFLSSSLSLLSDLCGYKGIFGVFLGVWGPLLAFSRWSVRTVVGRDDSTAYYFLASFLFFFCPAWLCGGYLGLPEVWGLLPVFSRCSVWIIPLVDVFLMNLWKETSSMSSVSIILNLPSKILVFNVYMSLALLYKFTLVILFFDAIVDCFLISLSDSLLLVCKNKTAI